MGLFDDLSNFLETRLEEFLRNNPHLELQALEEQVREQEEDTLQLIADLERQDEKLKADILETAQEIQLWHARIAKAKAANRWDLVEPAEAREAALLRQGNQFWGQRQGVQARLDKAQELLRQIQLRRKEVQQQVAQAQATRAAQANQAQQPSGWDQAWSQSYRAAPSGADPLDEKFKQWEMDEELERLKRQMGR